jgi:hypothetical protein
MGNGVRPVSTANPHGLPSKSVATAHACVGWRKLRTSATVETLENTDAETAITYVRADAVVYFRARTGCVRERAASAHGFGALSAPHVAERRSRSDRGRKAPPDCDNVRAAPYGGRAARRAAENSRRARTGRAAAGRSRGATATPRSGRDRRKRAAAGGITVCDGVPLAGYDARCGVRRFTIRLCRRRMGRPAELPRLRRDALGGRQRRTAVGLGMGLSVPLRIRAGLRVRLPFAELGWPEVLLKAARDRLSKPLRASSSILRPVYAAGWCLGVSIKPTAPGLRGPERA